MQLSRLQILFLLIIGLLQGGCVAQNANSVTESVWRERCGMAHGWKFCFLVPSSTHEDRIDHDFELVRGHEGKRLIFSPWNSWTGKHWDELVAVVSIADALPAQATDSQLLAWAGLWDAVQRKWNIAAGQSASSLPNPYKTRVLMDARGRRWALGERRWRELNISYTRIERRYVMPIGADGVKLEISLQCSYPHPNCGGMDRMISEARWEKLE